MKTLTEIADSFIHSDSGGNGIDKGTIRNAGHSYTYFYDKLFTPLRNKPILMLEIGVCGGFSLKMWHEYFDQAVIIGLDINIIIIVKLKKIK